jgi:signal transduction histidine kinase
MRRYQHWLNAIADGRKNGTTPAMWLGTAALVLFVLVLASSVPPFNDWFQLPLLPALCAFLPSFVLGIVAGWFDQRGRVSLKVYGALFLVGAVLLQFFFGVLIALSRPPGALALASLLVLTTAFHGYVARASTRFPYMLFCSALALCGAVLVNPTREVLTLFAFVFPTGLMVSVLTGNAGLQEHEDRRKAEKLRQAVYYRMLDERSRETSRISSKLIDLLSNHHDAGNILSTVFLNAQLLDEQLERVVDWSTSSAEVTAAVSRLLEHLGRLKSMIQRGHAIAEDVAEVLEAPVLEIVGGVASDCRSLYPQTRISIACSSGEALCVLVHDGALGLRRIVENLMHNACEGNGDAAANNVRIVVEQDGQMVALHCIDNGPGFSPTQLDTPLHPFQTTKKDGHGLGLYSVHCLIQASGGTLERQNASEGGARVSVRLPRGETQQVMEELDVAVAV